MRLHCSSIYPLLNIIERQSVITDTLTHGSLIYHFVRKVLLQTP